MAESRIGRAGVVIASGTLVSRLLGLVRMAVLAYAIGSTGLAANAFATAIKIPNTIYVLIATGALTAVLVPQITKAALAKDGGQAYINKLVTLAIAGSAVLVPIAAVVTPFVIDALGAGWNNPAQTHLATLMAFWLLPQILFYTLYTVVGEVLNARSVFGPYAWTPALNNVISIAGLVAFIVIYGPDRNGVLELNRWDPLAIALVAGSATLGVAVQGIALFAFWRRAGISFALDFRFRGVGLSTMGKVAFWTFMTVIVTQAVALFQTGVLNLATGSDEAGLAAFELVSLIFVLPHAIITISLVTANFTRMSESVHRSDHEQMKQYLSGATRITVFAMTFFTFAMIVLAMPITAIILRSSYDVVQVVAVLLVLNVVCLVPYSLNFVLNRGFFVLSDTRTPFFIITAVSVLMVGAAVIAGLQPTAMIANTLSLLASIIVALQTIATFVILRQRIGPLGGRRLLLSLSQCVIAGVAAAVVGALVLWALGGIGDGAFAVSGIVGATVVSAVVTIAMAVVYLAATSIMRNAESRTLTTQLGRLLRRG